MATGVTISKPPAAPVTALVQSARRHYAAGRFREAQNICLRVLEEHGEYGIALQLLGLIAGRSRRLDESAQYLRRAVKTCPNAPEFRNDLGVTLEAMGDLGGAIECYRRVLAAVGDAGTRRHGDAATGSAHSAFSIQNSALLSQTLTNLANALLHRGEIGEAKEAVERALRVNPQYAPAHNAAGCILLEQNKAVESCESFRRAISLWPEFNEAKSNLGRAMLTMGEFEEGWRWFAYLHSARLASHAGRKLGENNDECGMMNDECAPPAPDSSPRLRVPASSRLDGKTVLLYGEGGLGNIIQFARYATLLAERGARVVFEAPKPLVKLLRTVPGIDQVIEDGSTPPTYHFHASIMDLPRFFGTTLDTVPATIPYVTPDAGLVEHWEARLDEEIRNPNIENRNNIEIQSGNDRNGETRLEHSDLADSNLFRISEFEIRASRPRRVGICWQAEQRTSYGRQRTIPLAHFAVLSQVPHVRLISLQKDWHGHAAFPIEVIPDLDKAHGAFMDSAAIMKHLDLVITADTSIAHLAGALGVPVSVAVRYVPDWRWMLDRADSPWYPTMRLFRQKTPGVWRDVFEAMGRNLSRPDLAPIPLDAL